MMGMSYCKLIGLCAEEMPPYHYHHRRYLPAKEEGLASGRPLGIPSCHPVLESFACCFLPSLNSIALSTQN